MSPRTLDMTQSNGTGSCVGSIGHSQAMAASGQIWHVNPAYPRASVPNNFCESTTMWGENVGMASGPEWSALQTITNLMMQEPHSAAMCATQDNHACNILNPAFRRVGIGIVVSGGATWLTEDFLL